MKYWNEGNGIITDDSSDTPIVEGFDMYIETYELRNSSQRISIAYTQEIKDNTNMYYFRQNVLKNHNLEFNDLGNLIRFAVPKKVYDEIYRTGSEG